MSVSSATTVVLFPDDANFSAGWTIKVSASLSA